MEIGQKVSPMMEALEDVLLEHACFDGSKPNYTKAGFRAAVYMFSSAMQDKMWELQEKEEIPMDLRVDMVQKFAAELRSLIKTYSDIDTFELFK